MAKGKKIFHVVKSIQGWKAEHPNSDKSLFRSPVKKEVIDKALQLARKEKESQVIVFKTDGTVQEEYNFPIQKAV